MLFLPGRHMVEDLVALWIRRTEVPTACRYRSGAEMIEGILRGMLGRQYTRTVNWASSAKTVTRRGVFVGRVDEWKVGRLDRRIPTYHDIKCRLSFCDYNYLSVHTNVGLRAQGQSVDQIPKNYHFSFDFIVLSNHVIEWAVPCRHRQRGWI